MKLTDREKILAGVLAVLVVITLLYYLVISPLAGLRATARDRAFNTRARSDELQRIHAEIQTVRAGRAQYDSILADKNDNITTLISQFAATNDISQNLGNTTRSETNLQNKFTRITTDVKLEGAPIQAIIKMISDIENHEKMIIVESFRISAVNLGKGQKTQGRYDAQLKINTYMAE